MPGTGSRHATDVKTLTSVIHLWQATQLVLAEIPDVIPTAEILRS